TGRQTGKKPMVLTNLNTPEKYSKPTIFKPIAFSSSLTPETEDDEITQYMHDRTTTPPTAPKSYSAPSSSGWKSLTPPFSCPSISDKNSPTPPGRSSSITEIQRAEQAVHTA